MVTPLHPGGPARSGAVLGLLVSAGLVLVLLRSGQPLPTEGTQGDERSLAALRALHTVYLECATYRDEGEVEQVFVKDGGRRTVRLPFETAFVRDGGYRYEFRSRRGEEEWDRYVVWRDGDTWRSWWSVGPQAKEATSLNGVLAGPSGVSGGSATIVPGLLQAGPGWGDWLTQPGSVALEDPEVVDGRRCDRLRLEYGTISPPWTVWVDQEQHLVRRMFQSREVNDFVVETTIAFRPEVGVAIPAAELAFEPPPD